MATKQELLDEAEARGLDVPAGTTKAELEALLASGDALEDANGGEEVAAEDDPQPLEGTPVVDNVTVYVELGVAVELPGDVADDAELVEGKPVDDTEPLLEATDPGPIRLDNLAAAE